MNPPISVKPWQSRVVLANLVAQTLIVVTGGLVRLTSSGLGCPTWPECVAGSITPTSSQTQAWHKYVEFGNRMLTFAVVIVAMATIAAVFSHNKARYSSGQTKRRQLTVLSVGSMAGIFAQAILGGITVLTGLNPLTVAAHFLLSIGLITAAYLLHYKIGQAEDSPSSVVVHPYIRTALKLHIGLALLVITLGTLVTGSGPHAGDSANIKRLGFDPRVISWIHADTVLLFMGLTCGLVVALFATNAPAQVRTAGTTVVIVGFSQGLVGYVQYFTGLPWAVVTFHMFGACLLWIATLSLWCHSAQQGDVANSSLTF